MEEEGFGGQMTIAMAVYPSGHHLPSFLPRWNMLMPQGWQPAAFSLKVQDLWAAQLFPVILDVVPREL